MCGVVGVVSKSEVSPMIYDALTILQHRGQDAAGIATCDQDKFHLRKQLGLVRDVFRDSHMINLRGSMGIGHLRYPTAGSQDRELAQPMYVNSPYGISISHNGNLTNREEISKILTEKNLRFLSTDSDSEVLLNVLPMSYKNRALQHLPKKKSFLQLELLIRESEEHIQLFL